MRRYILAAAALAVVFVPAAALGETLESVEKKIIELQSKYKSLQMKSRHKLDMDAPQMKMKQNTETTTEAARKGDTWQSRTESKMTGTRKLGDSPEQKDEMTSLTIFDGKANYILNDSGGQKTAMKVTPDKKQNINPLDPAAQFKFYHEQYDLKLLPDEDVDGKACYVIEGKSKKPEQGMLVRMLNYYRKDNGIAVRVRSFNDAGKEVMVWNLTDLKIDPEISPDRFVFKAPPGVQVRDLDKEMKQAEAAPPEAEKTSEKPAAQPKPEEKKKDGVKGLLKGILK